MDEAAAVDELYRTPPRDFVAARNAVVAAMRSAGERDAAARIAKLRRPSPAHWALNTVAARDPAAVARWVVAASAVRDAQGAAVAGAAIDLRAALAELRASAAAIVALAPSGAPTADLTRALSEIASSPDATHAFGVGLLGADEVARTREPLDTASSQRAPAALSVVPPARAVTARDRAAVARALAAAERDAAAATGELEAIDAAIAAAAEAIDAARSALAEAEREHHREVERRTAAKRRATAAAKAVARARTAHAALDA